MAPGPWGRFVENVSGKLAFFPPRPATYRVEEHKDGTGDDFIQPLDRWAARAASRKAALAVRVGTSLKRRAMRVAVCDANSSPAGG
eukprot:329569-Chlamydomonas_euryale.AAC.4